MSKTLAVTKPFEVGPSPSLVFVCPKPVRKKAGVKKGKLYRIKTKGKKIIYEPLSEKT